MNHATGPASLPGTARHEHWDAVYSSRGDQQVSWYQADPRLSAELITDAAAGMAAGRAARPAASRGRRRGRLGW